MKKWLYSLASEFVEGLADGFIIAAGGAQAAAAISSPEQMQQIRTLTPQELVISMLIAGGLYVAFFVKQNKPPFGQSEPSAPTPPSSAT